MKFETKPIEEYPLPTPRPVTGAWRNEGKRRPYKVIDIDSLTSIFRLAVSRIYNMGGKAE